ncbi:ubiquitin-conjugating enzyme family protein, putative [Ichthyophthirius multifiliis]|uniref:E2 ubiquitin-conjugating enzyme n=1 Tax=Ichthyophthirius multifiliis TaxID=5932 RepID=G0QKT4_ICHMU|nr:ubiquitin-conjugating enzyme family protein, putative [Ichthyophthirius multifiliis]EGR34169.1 ubiquitin-conjugating enzyme family protein, putative [Ichthyophthirius multifiliis]|eukprot:XP_004039473.1 ubiquitin-conjugating enzyme family protein, putative [Ichthyophthirius multifiliis]
MANDITDLVPSKNDSFTFNIGYKHIESGKGKADELRNLVQNSMNGIISFNSTGYKYFITEQPRPYEVVIFFTAPNCNFCDQLISEYVNAAQIYYENNAHYPYQEDNKKLRAVFFGIMSFQESVKDVFIDLEFKSVPNILVSIPKHAVYSEEEKGNFLKIYKWQISGSDGHVTMHKLLEYINNRTGRNVEYKVTNINIIIGLTIFVCLMILTIIVFKTFKSFFLNTKMWFIVSCVIYFFCIAGFIYNIIHNVPLTQIDQKGQFQWIMDNQRMQLGAEGFVASGSILFAALTIIFWHYISKLNFDTNTVKMCYISVFGLTFLLVLVVEDIYKKKGCQLTHKILHMYSEGPNNARISIAITRQLNQLKQKSPDGIHIIINDTDIFDIQADVKGPVGTPYENGTFRCKLILPQDFPLSSPKGFFHTKIFHPNISDKGEICVNTLKKDWNPQNWSFYNIFEVIKCLLVIPFPESALNEEAAKQFMENYDEYFKYAKLMTQLYGKPRLNNEDNYEQNNKNEQKQKQNIKNYSQEDKQNNERRKWLNRI